MTGRRIALWALAIVVAAAWANAAPAGPPSAAEEAKRVLVVANGAVPASVEIAEHYMKMRGVPEANLVKLDLPDREEISYADYLKGVQRPLVKFMTKRKMLVGVGRGKGETRIDYIVTTYGLPIRVKPTKGDMRRSPAALDSMLSALPEPRPKDRSGRMYAEFPAYSKSPYYKADVEIGEFKGDDLFLVTRIDGPTPALARNLVNLALEAEKYGVEGVGYFDLAQKYKAGDEWMKGAAKAAAEAGYEVVIDTEKSLIWIDNYYVKPARPAWYFGWYTDDAYGPFNTGTLKFVPGAVAYHLFSFSGDTIDLKRRWVGPLIARGATATMGSVAEPGLPGTPHVDVFMKRFLAGYNFAEAAYMSQEFGTWQIYFVGDPLYRPFREGIADAQLAALQGDPARKDALKYAYIRRIRSMAARGERRKALDMARSLAYKTDLAALYETAAELYLADGNLSSAVSNFKKAESAKGTPQEIIPVYIRHAEAVSKSSPAAGIRVLRDMIDRYPKAGLAYEAYRDVFSHYRTERRARDLLEFAVLAAKNAGGATRPWDLVGKQELFLAGKYGGKLPATPAAVPKVRDAFTLKDLTTDAFWRGRKNAFSLEREDGLAKVPPTDVALAETKDALVVGFRCLDPAKMEVFGSKLKKGQPLSRTSSAEVLVSPTRDYRTAYVFRVTRSGAKEAFTVQGEKAFAGPWTGEAQDLRTGGWVARIVIPFDRKDLPRPYNRATNWTAQFARYYPYYYYKDGQRRSRVGRIMWFGAREPLRVEDAGLVVMED